MVLTMRMTMTQSKLCSKKKMWNDDGDLDDDDVCAQSGDYIGGDLWEGHTELYVSARSRWVLPRQPGISFSGAVLLPSRKWVKNICLDSNQIEEE